MRMPVVIDQHPVDASIGVKQVGHRRFGEQRDHGRWKESAKPVQRRFAHHGIADPIRRAYQQSFNRFRTSALILRAHQGSPAVRNDTSFPASFSVVSTRSARAAFMWPLMVSI